MDSESYAGREQALVKHWILKRYLEQLALKVAQFKPGTTLNYIDGFSGPWDAVAEGGTDSSPHIAMTELGKVRRFLAQRPTPIPLTLRAMFVERNPDAFERLQALCARFGDVAAEAYCGTFEDHIAQAVAFARTGARPFAFTFIDPTGWTGYALERIAPLLRVEPGEVLINFMTKDIGRFIDSGPESAAESFVALFGGDFRARWRSLGQRDREDAMVHTYCERVREEGNFQHVASAVVLNPQADRTHYHLIYGTRSLKGLITFREIEAKALQVQRDVRAKARAETRTERTGQLDLLEPAVTDTPYVSELMGRYQTRAFEQLAEALGTMGSIPYDEAICIALQSPMTAQRDVNAWLTERCEQGDLVVEGLVGRQRMPKLRAGHRLRWLR